MSSGQLSWEFEQLQAEFYELEERFPDSLPVNIAIIRTLRGDVFLIDNAEKQTTWINEACRRGRRMMELFPDSDRAKAEYCTSLHVAAVTGIFNGRFEEGIQYYLDGYEVWKGELLKSPSHWGYLVQANAMLGNYLLFERREDLRAQMIPVTLEHIERLKIIQPGNVFFNKEAGQVYTIAARAAELDLRPEDQLYYCQKAQENWQRVVDEWEDREEYSGAVASTGIIAAQLGLKEKAWACLDNLEGMRVQGIQGERYTVEKQARILMALGEWDDAEALLASFSLS